MVESSDAVKINSTAFGVCGNIEAFGAATGWDRVRSLISGCIWLEKGGVRDREVRED